MADPHDPRHPYVKDPKHQKELLEKYRQLQNMDKRIIGIHPNLQSTEANQLPMRKPNNSLSAFAEDTGCKFGSPKYFAYCGVGGMLACGLTHLVLTPIDLVKCLIQVKPTKYKGIAQGFQIIVQESGVRKLALGWAPTFIGYSAQGFLRFGLYEICKIRFAGVVGPEIAYYHRTALYLCAAATAEFFADFVLCPWEATKVRMQTQPGFAGTMREALPKIYNNEGFMGFYKGLAPLWMRQIPYTMMKFASFERTLEMLYKNVVPKPRDECTKAQQLVVTFLAGYIAGVFCAVVSHPADTVVSKLNQDQEATLSRILKKIKFNELWVGLLPRIVMVGSLAGGQWLIYDAVKVALNMPRPPPPEKPEHLRK